MTARRSCMTCRRRKYASLKATGDGMVKAAVSDDLSQEFTAGFQVVAACAKHGITSPRSAANKTLRDIEELP